MKRAAPAIVLLALLSGAGTADAHVITTGLGPLYDGAIHLAVSPEDLVPVIALGLFAGRRGPSAARRALGALPAGWLAGGVSAGLLASASTFPMAAISFLVLGLLTATDLAMKPLAVAVLAFATGLLHGRLEAIATAPEGGLVAGLGSALTATAVFLAIAGFTASIEAPWGRVAIRVLGSWTAAAGLLLAGWWLHRTG